MELHIMPECYIDTRLITALVPLQSPYNHQKGCSNVAKHMQTKLAGDFALGIIDKDKKVLDYLNECQSVCELAEFLQLFKHSRENHFLIVIKPAMERWIMNTAAVANLLLSDFDLPNDLGKLTDLTKTAKGDKDDTNAVKFGLLFREMKRINPPSVSVLIFWINYLKANPYAVDLTFIRQQTITLLGH